MRVIINRVKGASMFDGDKLIAQTGTGYFISLGITAEDTKAEADKLASKITAVRSFRTTTGDLDIHIKDICGEIMAVPDRSVVASASADGLDYSGTATDEQEQQLYKIFVDFFNARGLRCVGVPDFDKKYTVSADLNGVVTYVIDTIDL